MSFQKRIKLLRNEVGVTQEELAKTLTLSKSTISRYESGEYEPSQDVLKSLSEYFGVTTDYLLGLSDIRNPYEVKTIAAHHNSEEYSEEELKAIEEFKEMVRKLRGNKNE